MSQRQCLCCRVRFTPKRNLNQCYCSNPTCQKQRRRKYQKQKLKVDPDYRENQHAAERNWHKRHPDYWRNYRKNHPQQAEKNRLAQLKRNQKRLKGSHCCGVSLIATMYAFNAINIHLSLSYNDFLCETGVIATSGRYGQVTLDSLALPP